MLAVTCVNCKYKYFDDGDKPCRDCSVTGYGVFNNFDPIATDEIYEKPKNRADFLKEVEGIICKDRNEQYGEPEDNFKRIAVFWSNYLDREITSADVAIMMVLFKAARIANDKYKADSWVDICGYSACGAECAMKESGE